MDDPIMELAIATPDMKVDLPIVINLLYGIICNFMIFAYTNYHSSDHTWSH